MVDYRLETFLTLCETLSYTKAAELLNVTQPAVTAHINFLEDYYKTKLFSYQHRKLSLTEQGELLYIHVQNLKSNSLSIQGIIERSLHPQIIIKFGATLSIGEFMMPDIIAKIIKENPFANINMQVENTEILLNKMQLGEIDFALIEGTFPKTSYNYNKISTERFVCVSSPKRKESKNIKLANLQHGIYQN